MMQSSQRKTALVTGGNKGIGFAICNGLINAGFEVILAARAIDNAEAAADKLQPDKSQVDIIELDVADDNSIRRATDHVSQTISQLDVLVNNAGIYPDEGVDILTVSRDLLHQTLNTKTFGPNSSHASIPCPCWKKPRLPV